MLLMDTLPTTNQAYAIIIYVESHKALATHARILESRSIVSGWNYEL